MEDTQIYISYHTPDLVNKYNLKEDSIVKLFDTSKDPFHPYLNEFITQMYVYKNKLYGEKVGFQQYHKPINSSFYKNDFLGILNHSKLSFKGNTLNAICSPFLYNNFQTYIKENYDKNSNVYICFINEADVEREWCVKETYILHKKYFEEIVGLFTNFLEKIFLENGITRENPDGLKEFALKITNVITEPIKNRHRGIGYFIEETLGIYLGYIYKKFYQNETMLLYH